MEPAREALVREMRKEIGAEVEVDRLLWVAENFFEYGGEPWHELGLRFLMSIPDGSHVLSEDEFEEDEHGVKLRFNWFPIADLERVPLYPSFL